MAVGSDRYFPGYGVYAGSYNLCFISFNKLHYAKSAAAHSGKSITVAQCRNVNSVTPGYSKYVLPMFSLAGLTVNYYSHFPTSPAVWIALKLHASMQLPHLMHFETSIV